MATTCLSLLALLFSPLSLRLCPWRSASEKGTCLAGHPWRQALPKTASGRVCRLQATPDLVTRLHPFRLFRCSLRQASLRPRHPRASITFKPPRALTRWRRGNGGQPRGGAVFSTWRFPLSSAVACVEMKALQPRARAASCLPCVSSRCRCQHVWPWPCSQPPAGHGSAYACLWSAMR